MNRCHRVACALVLATAAVSGYAADYFWSCTKPDGVKYWDARKCDKGDTAVKVRKGNPSVLADATVNSLDAGVCPADPAYCSKFDYGVVHTSPRAQAISQFMRDRQCEFLKRFPERCEKPR